jgi:hypothetical protein
MESRSTPKFHEFALGKKDQEPSADKRRSLRVMPAAYKQRHWPDTRRSKTTCTAGVVRSSAPRARRCRGGLAMCFIADSTVQGEIVRRRPTSSTTKISNRAEARDTTQVVGKRPFSTIANMAHRALRFPLSTLAIRTFLRESFRQRSRRGPGRQHGVKPAQ